MVELKGRLENARVSGSEDIAILRTYFWIAVAVLVCTLGYVVIQWLFVRWREYRELKNQRVETELQLLKNKIDPHFFFNTLNNLYGLAREKSEDTPEVILKLSDIMRYVIYEGENERVLLSDDVEYLEKYLELHRIRHQHMTKLNFHKEVDQWDIEIAPLLLVILVENAIKHGIEQVAENTLDAKLSVAKGQLSFEVRNKHDYEEMSTKGTGLKNLKRRLELIYPQRHSLETQMNGDEFLAKLEIKLV